MSFAENKDAYKVWVFAPFLETADPNLKFYYDYSQSIDEYTKVFAELLCEWEWVNITIDNINEECERIKSYSAKKNIVLNLCDGDEINGVPGISVIYALEVNNLIYTGSDAYFFDITTSKITMKNAFDQYGVATPNWIKLNGDISEITLKGLGDTAIVKPAVSAGSMGLTIKNVVSNFTEFENILQEIKKGYRGWKLDEAGLIAEQFVSGREFTTFIVGSSTIPEKIKFYRHAERIFHPSLPEKEQFLSFDRLWETYDEESPMPNNDTFYEYAEVSSVELADALQDISLAAFNAVKGMGYARLDIRMDKNTQKLYVLEVNAQCGISDDENYTSIGAILRFSKKTFTNLIIEILEDALLRQKIIL